MSKTIVFSSQAREELKKGVDILANAVKVTLGPKGRNVIIEGMFGTSSSTKDGVTVAKAVEIEDPIQNIGAQMIKNVASKTVDVAGDGTTTATIIAQEIINSGFKMIAAGANPSDLKKGIDKAVKIVVQSLKEQTQIVGNDAEKIEQIATISANNDSYIGKLISDAFSKVGKDGVITVEESPGISTYVDIIEGMQFDRGYISPYFITNSEKMKVEMQNPYILIYDKRISTMKDILPILEKVAVANRNLVIICEDLEGEALSSLVYNKIQGKLKVAAIKAPSFGNVRKEILQDIAVLTNGTYISQEQGLKLEEATILELGEAASIVIDKDSTTIIGGKGETKDIDFRINQIRVQMESTKDPIEKKSYHDRLSKLAGGVAVLYVGAITELEMKEKKDRIDDALHATRAAVEEGIIPGGGVAYIRSIDKLLNETLTSNQDEKIGVSIIHQAIQAPIKVMLQNADENAGAIIGKIEEGTGDYGYNAQRERFENFFTTGVVDPTKVARVALENAASIAGTLLITECVIANNNNKINNN